MLTESEFEEIQQRLVSAWHREDLKSALAQIEIGLREGTPEMKGQCLFYRGMIRESDGALGEAKQDWVDGVQFAPAGTFLRYQLEHHVAQACEKSEATQEALGWYRAALRTCSTGGEFSGHQTLSAFVRINGRGISPEDTPLVASVIEKSWRVLELSDRPAPTDLPGSIVLLDARFKEMIAQARHDDQTDLPGDQPK